MRQPRNQRVAIGHVGQDDDTGPHRAAPRRRRAPREHRAFERARARRHEIDVRRAAAPAAPCAVLFLARGDSPARVGRKHPILRRGHPGRCRQPRAKGVEEYLCEALQLRAVGLDRPDVAERRIVDGKARWLREALGGSGDAGDCGKEDGGGQNASHVQLLSVKVESEV